MSWQRASIQAAAVYLREQITSGAGDARTRTVYEGLLEVLDPSRRATRLRRELAESTRTVPIPSARERRTSGDRRTGADRRTAALGPPAGAERRASHRRATARRGGR